ncbi:MAG: GGDEF domain-containing protein [Oscillospiraceae bacterium]|nr:GGDEF domain-containing protein [Oscillospiraceae bacterium]
MNENQEKNKTMHIVVLVICSLFYLILWAIMGPLKLEAVSAYMGVLSSLLVVLNTIMVVTNRKRGFIVACILSSMSIMSAAISVLRSHSATGLPGIFTPIVNIITMSIILTYLNTSAKQSEELKEQYEKIMDVNRVMQEKDEAIRAIAYTDALTGMYNMRYFREKVDEAINLKMPFSILYVDIDNFKSINDTFGPKTGDAALKIYAERVTAYCGRRYVCARVSGDEFGIILTGEQTEADVLNIVEQLRSIFGKQITAQMTTLSVTASFGIVSCPKDGNDAEILLDHAIMAVYNAKANGKDRPCFFS